MKQNPLNWIVRFDFGQMRSRGYNLEGRDLCGGELDFGGGGGCVLPEEECNRGCCWWWRYPWE